MAGFRPSFSRHRFLGFAAGLALAGFLAGCGGSAGVRPEAPPLVWPAPPEPPRVAWVSAFSRPADLGIERSFLQRLRDFIFGEDETRMVRPMAVVEAGGTLFVADPGIKGVHRFDRSKADYQLIGGPGESALPSPVGLARGARGEIYVADSRLARVLVIEPGAREARALDLEGELLQPTGLAYDLSGQRLFVVDTRAHRINVYDVQGRRTAVIGERGSGPGQFNYPTMISLAGPDRIYVTDSLNYRVQILDGNGRFAGQFGRLGDGTGDAARQKGIATDRDGHVYIVDSLFHTVQVFDPGGRYLLSLGSQGQDRGEFWLPTGITIGGDDLIYVADAYNRRVQILRYLGERG
ncbi:MAG: 6-bladed beta-propeller [Pseudomonadota bacterium]